MSLGPMLRQLRRGDAFATLPRRPWLAFVAIACHCGGRTFYVPLAEIRQEIPPLWVSLCDAAIMSELLDGGMTTKLATSLPPKLSPVSGLTGKRSHRPVARPAARVLGR